MIKEYRKLKKDKMLKKRMVSKDELKMRKAERREKRRECKTNAVRKRGKKENCNEI